MKKKFLMTALSLVCVLGGAFGLAACGETNGDNSGNVDGNQPEETHTHNMVKTDAVAATCTTDGNSEYWTCQTCNKYFSDKDGNTETPLSATAIPALGHDIIPHNAQAATCTEVGWSAYNSCSRCDYTTYQELPTEHKWSNNKCLVCGHDDGGTIGLQYNLINDGTYKVSVGTATDANIIIPSSYNGIPITYIDDWAFAGCSSLTSITIPDSVTHINYWTFSRCSSLTSITIGNGVTYIDYSAFYGCSSLTSITIPDSVTSISEYAFSGCSSLTDINFNGTIAQWNTIMNDHLGFGYTFGCTVHCTDGDIEKS